MTSPQLWLVRHGETAWSIAGRHTGRTDLPLDDPGRSQAEAVAPLLRKHDFVQVMTSPLQRARETCTLAGFGDRADVVDDLQEWDYGDYDGRTTAEIRAERPDWSLWRDGCPGGEDAAQVGQRVDRVIARVRTVDGDVLAFAHGHLLRVLAARTRATTRSARAATCCAVSPPGHPSCHRSQSGRVVRICSVVRPS